MSYVLKAEDLRRIDRPTRGKAGRDADAFLGELQRHLDGSDLIVRLGAASDDQESVISRDPFGEWVTGRYIGDVRLGDRTLRIAPRVGHDVVEGWLATVMNLVALPESSTGEHSDVFVARLLAILWCRAIEGASRHGPPSFRAERSYEGLHVRGALDVRGTAALRARGSAHLRSTARFRDLQNDVARTLVAADRTLGQHLRGVPWRTRTTEALNAQLVAAVGARPRLPSLRDLGRHRYTPITRPYRDAAMLSHRIASQLGTAFQADAGSCDGLLLDVAELWELFLLQATRDAFPDDVVEHGTPEGEDEQRTYLLSSPQQRRGLGRLKPDIVVRRTDGSIRAVLDAKYKSLAFRRPDRSDGVDRADLYQLASYLSRYDPSGDAVGALLYPDALRSEGQAPARAQEGSPWSVEDRWAVHFATVPVTREAARDRIRQLLASLQGELIGRNRSHSEIGSELQRPPNWTFTEHLLDDLEVDFQSADRCVVRRETNHE